MVYIEILTSHYGLMKEDIFLGHATNAPALFNKGNAAAEFQAFKHQMYIYRQHSSSKICCLEFCFLYYLIMFCFTVGFAFSIVVCWWGVYYSS